MAAASVRVLVLLLAVSVSSLRRTAAAAATTTVEAACQQHTKHPEFCVKALSSANPEMKAAALNGGLPGIAELSLSLAAQRGAETVAFVKGLERMPGGMPPECLEECVAKFQAAVDALKRSEAAVERGKDESGVSSWLSAAKSDGETCMSNCHRTEGGTELQIVDKVTDLTQMCSIALSLTDASVHKPTAA
jgi:pectinesterase inhibitor-like protein